MNRRNLFLRYFGLFVFFIGLVFNILMIANNSWPTFLFLIICLIGILQIAISFNTKNLNIYWQIVLRFIPIVLGYIILEINSASKDIFLIPDNYRGEIIIHYGIENGADKERDGFWRVYKIPSNGILETQYKLAGESVDNGKAKFFYVSEDGTTKRLKTYYINSENKDTISPQIISIKLWRENNKDILSFLVNTPNSKRFEKN